MIPARIPLLSRLQILPSTSVRTGSRRLFADHPSSTTSHTAVAPSGGNVPTPTRSQNPQKRFPGPRGGRSGSYYVMLMAGVLLTVPPISYFYWEHRKAHMKAKKEAILHDIQARVRAQS